MRCAPVLPGVHRALLAGPLSRGRRFSRRGAASEKKRDQAKERQCNKVLLHCATETR
jgi:hypothetical protein